MNSARIVAGPIDVEFNIDRGVTAIFGDVESGRKLLLDAIAGFERPSSGRILLNDAILFDAASGVHLPPQRRRCVLIPADDSLFAGMTPKQNLMLAAKHWPRLERHRRVAEMMEKFGLSDDSPKIRWIAARALIAEPKLLLIDDPGLDAKLLGEIRENTEAPVLVGTGNLDLCCSADHMIVLNGGRVLQRGAPREILDQPVSVEVARLTGLSNVFQATVGALDPGRNESILDFGDFSLRGRYFKGHFRGDRVWVAIATKNLRVRAVDGAAALNCVRLELVRTVARAESVLLEFAHGVSVPISHTDFARQKDNREWLVEFPPEALRIL